MGAKFGATFDHAQGLFLIAEITPDDSVVCVGGAAVDQYAGLGGQTQIGCIKSILFSLFLNLF